MSGADPHRILLIRTDRVGDVVLTLPLVGMIRDRFPGATVSFLAREYTRELFEGVKGVSEVLTIDEKPEGDLLRKIRDRGFDVAVHVFPRPRLAWIAWRAGIPMRIGTAYRWYSFLFSHRMRDHRKGGTLHESEYNARLLRPLGIDTPPTLRPSLVPTDLHRTAASRVRSRIGLGDHEKVVVVHPGSGGSARDWSVSNFSGLAQALIRSGVRVVVSGSSNEVDLAEQIVRSCGGAAVSVAGDLTLMGLAALLERASLFVSNSTGPLHIAAAVGTPVIGFFPPITATGVHRWGPLGERVFTFTPDASRCVRCHGGPCQGNTCMDQITIGMVTEKATEMLMAVSGNQGSKEEVRA